MCKAKPGNATTRKRKRRQQLAWQSPFTPPLQPANALTRRLFLQQQVPRRVDHRQPCQAPRWRQHWRRLFLLQQKPRQHGADLLPLLQQLRLLDAALVAEAAQVRVKGLQ